ncbi:helix-turn-helix domain-containing protein [Bacillus paralicheniformis]|uniref:helix-turn-helix domain-containing protein n=1 Tax=Bacillus paralicheniformis TaxID=1648923 RepID=UPI00227FF614|nr:helix-turn-helix domain-containing protein [Bacillus paralicheniformis]MCY8152602.1 helix-turn-helix domain-containing protein [Bacillus paralicheniformis]
MNKDERHITVEEATRILSEYKITNNIESVRRWLRKGVILGIKPISRKEGWRIKEADLMAFINSRIPSTVAPGQEIDEQTRKKIREEAREEMFWELFRELTFTGHIEVKKSRIKDCIEHLEMPKWCVDLVWEACIAQGWGTKKNPRIYYILDAFVFDGKRVKMDTNFGDIEEQILFAVIEEVRLKRVNGF